MVCLQIISSEDYENIKREGGFYVLYGFHSSPFGNCLIGLHEKKVCHLSFVTGSERENLLALEKDWPGAEFDYNREQAARIIDNIFDFESERFQVFLKGTPFEAKVWQELLNIPSGSTCSYEDVAERIGRCRAVRAVANAIAKNPVCYLIPCHRVIRKNGNIHKYGWGSEIKRKIIDFEKFYV